MDFELEMFKEFNVAEDKIFKIKDSQIFDIGEKHFKSEIKENKSEYMNLIENLPFSQTGKNPIYIDNEDIYLVEFVGNPGKCKVELFIISYSEKIKLKVESLNLNEKIYFYPIKEAKSIRLAIKVSSEGEFVINSIKIYKAKLEKFKNFESIDPIKVDKPTTLKELRVACIFDEFTKNCYKEMVDLIEITPYNWKIELSIRKPHLLIVESAWEGKDKLWHSKISNINPLNLSILSEVTLWCKENNIPTMFWNKEDPVHFKGFISACKYFDYIFTTDEGSIEKYKEILCHNRIYAMPFACQPKIHNPIKYFKDRINKACFAGTYYGEKFKERKQDTDNILDASIETIGLDIFDRQYNLKNSVYKFPEKYQNYIQGSLEANELDLANKGYKININVNTVKYSTTMFSRRVFESLACGTPIVSSYSTGIKNIFNELVFCSDNFNEIKKELDELNNNENYYTKKVIQGIRTCMTNHTYQNRLEYMLNKANINLDIKKTKVTLISIVETQEELELIISIYKKQTYDMKNLVLLFKDYDLFINTNLVGINSIEKFFLNENLLVSNILSSDYIAFIDYKNFYGKYYIEDLVNASKYCTAEFIGKKSYYKSCKRILKYTAIKNNGCEFEYVDSLDLDKCIFKLDIISKNTVNELVNYINNNNIERFRFGCRYFSIDRYNFIEGDNNLSHIDIDNIEI